MEKNSKTNPYLEFWQHFSQNKGALIGLSLIIFFTLVSFLGPLLAPHSPSTINENALRLPPLFLKGGHSQFILGTDDLGRDLLSRLIYGSRVSMLVGLLVVFFSATIGTLLGLLAGYFGGKVDWLIMRIVDMLMAFPSILLAIVVVSVLGPGLLNAILAVSLVATPSFIRIVRAQVMGEKNKQYVQAAKTFGASNSRIMFKEILPNSMAPLIVQISLGFSDGILNTAALGFLGLGAQAPTPEWGIMLADARAYITTESWMVTFPGLCILLVVLGFNLFGDGLRDALDPRLKS